MYHNDKLVLESILNNRQACCIPSNQMDEVMEYFTEEQLLKPLKVKAEEIVSGNVDGADDGGIDGIYILCDGVIANEKNLQYIHGVKKIEILIMILLEIFLEKIFNIIIFFLIIF